MYQSRSTNRAGSPIAKRSRIPFNKTELRDSQVFLKRLSTVDYHSPNLSVDHTPMKPRSALSIEHLLTTKNLVIYTARSLLFTSHNFSIIPPRLLGGYRFQYSTTVSITVNNSVTVSLAPPYRTYPRRARAPSAPRSASRSCTANRS